MLKIGIKKRMKLIETGDLPLRATLSTKANHTGTDGKTKQKGRPKPPFLRSMAKTAVSLSRLKDRNSVGNRPMAEQIVINQS